MHVMLKQCTIRADMITEMRGADLIVFEVIKIRNIRNLMRVYFFESIKTVMEINFFSRGYFFEFQILFFSFDTH